MKSYCFSCFFAVFAVFSCCLGSVLKSNETSSKNYISWDDMKLHLTTNARDDFEKNRVILVCKKGKCDSTTVQGAIDMVPQHNKHRVKINILPGIYREKVIIPRTKPYISLIGNENRINETLITWNNKASDLDRDGVELGTYRSASVTIESDYFCAAGITFENTIVASSSGYGMQAVALRVAGDKSMFYKIRVLGTQDTLLDESGSHYFYQSYIQGTVDFIFGRGRSLYQDCVIHSTADKSGAIAAHHRDSPHENTGFSFSNCVINGSGKIYLGRAWGNFSRIVYSYCHIDNIITPSGWSDWKFPFRQKQVVFAEYECTGRGADRGGRVPWAKSFNYEEAKPYLDQKFISGDQWLRL